MTKANHPSISSLPQNNIEVICWNNAIDWHVHSRRGIFSGFVFHLVQNVYHKPCLPAAVHLVFADSARPQSLSNPSVKSREQTQSKLSLLKKTVFCFFRKQFLVTHSKSCAPCLGFKDLHQRMGSLPFHPSLSPLQPGPEPSVVSVSSLVLFIC